MKLRKPAVAGFFYPDDPIELEELIANLLQSVLNKQLSTAGGKPRFLICPHAGYQYSGKVQAQAMSLLEGQSYEKVYLFGPSHHFAFQGMIGTDAAQWETPLGKVDLLSTEDALGVEIQNHFHEPEHSLEVQLPFVQTFLPDIPITPILFSGSLESAEGYAKKFSLLDEDALFLISSDMHHVGPRFHYDPKVMGFGSGELMDHEILSLIGQSDILEYKVFLKRYQSTVCGALPILVAMYLAKAIHAEEFKLLAYDCSQNMVGGADSVGYASLSAK